MQDIVLKATSRDLEKNNLEGNRSKGLVPAVLYGQKAENMNLWVDLKNFMKAHKKAGENTIIELEIDDKKKENVLIYDFQEDTLTGDLLHVDFYRVDMSKKIEAEIPINFVGESPAVKEQGGVLVKNIDEIEVRCLPGDIPQSFDVDVSVLATFEDRIAVKDLKVSDKVEIDIDPETVIALVTPPRSEEEMAALDEKIEEDVSKVEGVEKETKEEEGEEAKEGEKPAEEKSE
ncbi:MAG: 50S ribosomal protein L25 [Candidatus Moranbacteria bacterium]|jgi:large subunit ribosomal protein L25|nr:50S ribosomal protein L25 [Candidatus Moranbacteria bacterium]MDX9855502.1 50S ribosomal protein L25 [Candidatus Moranbacteria bacterium]